MKKLRSCCLIAAALAGLIVLACAVTMVIASSPKPLGAEEGYASLTRCEPAPGVNTQYVGARRLRDGRVKAYTYWLWTGPTGEIISESEGGVILLRGDDVVLFSGEEHLGEDIFLRDGKLFLRIR